MGNVIKEGWIWTQIGPRVKFIGKKRPSKEMAGDIKKDREIDTKKLSKLAQTLDF